MTTSNIRAMRKELHQLLGRAAKVSEITVINVYNEGDDPEDSDLTSGGIGRAEGESYSQFIRRASAAARSAGTKFITVSKADA